MEETVKGTNEGNWSRKRKGIKDVIVLYFQKSYKTEKITTQKSLSKRLTHTYENISACIESSCLWFYKIHVIIGWSDTPQDLFICSILAPNLIFLSLYWRTIVRNFEQKESLKSNCYSLHTLEPLLFIELLNNLCLWTLETAATTLIRHMKCVF